MLDVDRTMLVTGADEERKDPMFWFAIRTPDGKMTEKVYLTPEGCEDLSAELFEFYDRYVK